ncbi:MAG: anti-sigma factor family protein [Acidobacteriota bacterium]
MRECKEIRERLSAFIDNELPAPERDLIERHLKQCTACAREEIALLQVTVLMDGIPDESPSRSFTPTTIHRASSWKRCSYVKGHILTPALNVLRSVFSVVPWPLEAKAYRRGTPVSAYLRSFDDFPPGSLSSIYLELIEGDLE